MTAYNGPTQLREDVETAIQVLGTLIPATVAQYDTHCVIQLDGFDDEPDVINAIAVYLVGTIAACVDTTLVIREALFAEGGYTSALNRDVATVIGQNNAITPTFRTNTRDAWLWEGISHLIVHLSRFDANKHPPAQVLAKTSVHLSVKDHGLDLIALYGTDDLGISAGECKAYLSRPATAIKDASDKLHEVDDSKRDAEIRQALAQFRAGLPTNLQSEITGAFWRNERAYFPLVCCDGDSEVDWTVSRVPLCRLEVPPEQRFLVPVVVPNAGEFFDAVADAMRAYAHGSLGED